MWITRPWTKATQYHWYSWNAKFSHAVCFTFCKLFIPCHRTLINIPLTCERLHTIIKIIGKYSWNYHKLRSVIIFWKRTVDKVDYIINIVNNWVLIIVINVHIWREPKFRTLDSKLVLLLCMQGRLRHVGILLCISYCVARNNNYVQ